MTFLALRSTNLLYRYTLGTIHLATLHILMVFFVDAVKSIVFKLHFGFAVTVHTPAHAKVRELLHFTHFLNFTMAGLALYLSGFYVLGMVYASMAWSFRQTLDDRWAVLDVWADVMQGWIEDAWQDAALHTADTDPWKVSPNPQQLGERLLSATLLLPDVDATKRDALCAAFAERFKTTDVYDGVCP
jgi:hypothetical protein